MTTLTILKDLIKEKKLLVVPRDEYEEFLHFRLKNVKEVKMTPLQKRALERARKNFADGKFLTIYELTRKLRNELPRCNHRGIHRKNYIEKPMVSQALPYMETSEQAHEE